MKRQKDSITFLDEKLQFPPLERASPEGLLAVGGDLSPERLILAYSKGIFPWFNEDSLILWWAPDPRTVLFPQKIRISRSMRKTLASNKFQLTKNKDFRQVIEACASIERKDQEGTWITASMKEAFIELHEMGYAISYEVWNQDRLVGGLYGIDLGHVFCGESMFSLERDASKFALIEIARELEAKNYKLIDCQLKTDHLISMGAEEISREEYMKILKSEV